MNSNLSPVTSHLIDSAMETMHLLGAKAQEIAAAMEELFPVPDLSPDCPQLSEEPCPERAFPDHFYYRPTPMTQVLEREAERITEVFKEDLRPVRLTTNPLLLTTPQWIPHKPRPVVEYPGQWCHCGHKWEEHMPCCVHLVEGCGCEEFLRVPMGTAEGA